MKLTGSFFDGKSSHRHVVGVELDGQHIVIAGHGIACREPLDTVEIGECLDGGTVTLRLRDGATCELSDGPAFESSLKHSGLRRGWAERLQRHALGAFVALTLVVGLGVSGYRWGLPWAAEQLAPNIPGAAVSKLGRLILKSLERELLKPTRLPPERQAALQRGLTSLAGPAIPEHRLLFRSSPQLGANAFALPDGTVVVLDRLVQDATDEQVVAVVAHELGHVAHYHPMRRLIQDAIVSTAVAAYVGDLSSAAATATALVLNASYSRDFELQADRYAAERLIEAGRDPLDLATLLEKIDRQHRTAGTLFSTHPDVIARKAALRQIVALRSAATAQPRTAAQP